jgi:DNA modification methylase
MNTSLGLAVTVWSLVPGASLDHPAPFPPAIIQPLIEASCPPGGLVLDPFIGRGTAGWVAKSTGRHYIGCDTSAKYVELAERYIGQGYTLPMFEQPEPGEACDATGAQLALFGEEAAR